MRKRTRQRDAPRTRAAPSKIGSTLAMPDLAACTIKGKPTTAEATVAPCQVKSKLKLNHKGLPAPSAIIKKYPTTLGGRTSGKKMIVSTTVFPQKRAGEKNCQYQAADENKKPGKKRDLERKPERRPIHLLASSPGRTKPYFRITGRPAEPLIKAAKRRASTSFFVDLITARA